MPKTSKVKKKVTKAKTKTVTKAKPKAISKAKEISNDLQHCKQIAKENTSITSNISFWLLSPTAQTQYEDIYRKCMINRGHSVLN